MIGIESGVTARKVVDIARVPEITQESEPKAATFAGRAKEELRGMAHSPVEHLGNAVKRGIETARFLMIAEKYSPEEAAQLAADEEMGTFAHTLEKLNAPIHFKRYREQLNKDLMTPPKDRPAVWRDMPEEPSWAKGTLSEPYKELADIAERELYCGILEAISA